MIDLILSRHIRIVKFANYVANSINNEFIGFCNELVSDLLIDAKDSIFDDSINRIDKFLEKMHVKFYQLTKRIDLLLGENIDSTFKSEISFLERSFPGLRYDRTKSPSHELFGVPYRDHFSVIFTSLRKDITSNYKVSISYNHPDSFLLDKFRGSRKFNYKDSIFANYHNKLKSLVKSIILCFSSEVRFFFYFKNQENFPFFQESLPLSESKSKKKDSKLGVYSTSDFSPRNNSEVWRGCLPHFNSTLTQVPLFNLEESNNFDFKNWFYSQPKTFQKEVLGEKRFKLMLNDNYSYSQIFDFSRSNLNGANL